MNIQEIKEAFLEESEEYMNVLKTNLDLLRDSYPQADHEIITETYRAAHSIKGTAGFLALQNISKLAKAMEFAMMPLRDKTKDIDLGLIDNMKESSIFLESLINDIENSENYDIQPLVDKLSE